MHFFSPPRKISLTVLSFLHYCCREMNYKSGGAFSLHPSIYQFLQDIERNRTIGKNDFVKLTKIELSPELLLRFLAQLKNFYHPNLIRCRLTW